MVGSADDPKTPGGAGADGNISLVRDDWSRQPELTRLGIRTMRGGVKLDPTERLPTKVGL